MSDDIENNDDKFVLQSTRFGDLLVAKESVITFPAGIIGFPRHQKYILIDHKPPFSWLHSTEEGSLAFVVVDGAEFGQQYDLSIPFSYKECEFNADDEFAILVIVTVRADPRLTTANLKAPLFVNVKNRKGVQVIYDDQRFSTRYPLWNESDEGNAEGASEASPKKTDEPSK